MSGTGSASVRTVSTTAPVAVWLPSVPEADAVAGAHAVVVSALEQLNHIQTEIDTVATSLDADPSAFATDTPAGALEFQRFLLAKQREIVAVVEQASAEAAAKAEVLERLRESYRVSSV